MMAVVTPKMDVFAADVGLGRIYSSVINQNVPGVNDFSFDGWNKLGAHLLPGDKISWGIGDGGAPYTVEYIVGSRSYILNGSCPDGLASGDATSYTVCDLATASGGADTRNVEYWELTNVRVDNGDAHSFTANSKLTQIILTAHFPTTGGKKPEVKKVVVVEDEGPKAPPHEHTYTWVKTIETTEDVDGEWSYKCECGDVKYRIPESGAFAFIRNSIDKINKAPNGSTLEIKTSRWLVFTTAVADAISDRPDLTIKLSYLEGGHKGDRLITTLPAGTDLHQYLDEKGYVGFLYLKTIFPTERVAGK